MAELNDRLVAEVGVEAFYRWILGDRLADTRGERFKAHCPWHDDSDPSLSIDAAAGLWKCYAGCGEGDMVLFYAKVRGLDAQGDFKGLARAIEDEALGGRRMDRKPLPPPPPKRDDHLYDDLWEEHSTLVLAQGDVAQGVPPEYGAVIVHQDKPEAAILLPVYSPETGRLVSVKRRYLKAWCIYCRGTATESCQERHDDAIKKSLNLERICLACTKGGATMEPATRSCFVEHKDETVSFPVGMMGLRLLAAYPEATVVIDEGEKDMLALGKRVNCQRFIVLASSGGASSIPKGIAPLLRGRRVLLLFDADRAGKIGSGKWSRTLVPEGAKVSRCDLKEAPGGLIDGSESAKDVYDYIHAGGDVAALLKWAEDVPLEVEEKVEPVTQHKPSNGNGKSLEGLTYLNHRETDKRPVIRVTANIDLVVDAAEDVLLRSHVEIFQRSNLLVRVCRAGKRKAATGQINRALDAPIIDPLPADAVTDALSRVAHFEKFNVKEDDWVHVPPPDDVARFMLGRAGWRFRNLESVSSGPFIRPDGSVCETPGYDEETEVLYEPLGKYDPIPKEPTLDDARKALTKLAKPFEEFDFGHDYDLACTIAAILTIAGRVSIDGPVPAFAATAPTPGSGKGLLVNLVSTITMGHAPASTPWVEDERDWNNLVVSFGATGDQVVNIDNVDRTLQSEALASALTSVEFKARKFHSQRTMIVPLRMVWFITGNNLSTRGDLYRRIIPIEIAPDTEDPERRVFEHPDILAEVSRDRGSLLPAALTILRAFILAGSPWDRSIAPLGSFERWDLRVRRAVMWVMGSDPIQGLEKSKKTTDPDLRDMRSFLAAWNNTISSQPVTVRELLTMAEAPLHGALMEALCSLNYKHDKPPSAKALGGLLSKNRGRPHDGLRLVCRGENRNKVAIWAVEPSKD